MASGEETARKKFHAAVYTKQNENAVGTDCGSVILNNTMCGHELSTALRKQCTNLRPYYTERKDTVKGRDMER